MYVYLKGTSYIFFQAENRSNINSSKNKSMGKQILHTTKSNVSICDGPVQRNILNIYTVPGNFPLFLAAAFSIDSLTQK